MIFDAKLSEMQPGHWMVYVESEFYERILFHEDELSYVVKFCLLRGIKIHPMCFLVGDDADIIPSTVPPELSNL